MKIGGMLPFFDELSFEDRLDAFYEAGFRSYLFSFDERYEGKHEKRETVLKMLKQYGIEVGSGHTRFDNEHAHNFWEENDVGEKIFKQYLDEIEFARLHGIKTLVVHLNGENGCRQNETGLRRLREMVRLAEQYDLRIAVENIYSDTELDFIFDNIKSDNLGMCYDSGHENYFTKGADFLSKYADKVFALHIHDNYGDKDAHNNLHDGNIDWDKIAKRLARVDQRVNLDGEIRIARPKGKAKITKQQLTDLFKGVYEELEKLKNKILTQRKNLTHGQ